MKEQLQKVENVIKVDEGVFRINDCVQISNLSFHEDGRFLADLEYDETVITEEDAEKLVNDFIVEAIQDSLEQE